MELDILLPSINPWWRSGTVGAGKDLPYRRQVFGRLSYLMGQRQALVITGLRRVGKSTLMFQLMGGLIAAGTRPDHILYFSFDDQVSELDAVLDAFQKATGTDWKGERVHVFLDEIQKLEGWGAKVKLLYDNFPDLRFVLSGSASIQLEKDAMDDLAGRCFMETVPVLSLREYYELKHGVRIDRFELYRRELDIELDAFLRKPFPELVGQGDDALVGQYIRNTVLSKVIRVDAVDAFGDVDTRLLETLLGVLYASPGMVMNVDSLSRTLGVHKLTLGKYLYILEFSRLIRIVGNFRVSAHSASRKLRKVYPYDISLALAFNPQMDKGRIAECAVASKTGAEYYWRHDRREVDFILTEDRIVPTEVKCKDAIDGDDLAAVRYFMGKFNVKSGRVVYLGENRDLGGGIKAVNFTELLF